uniref:NADH-quinone oxidoreductase subunit J family protein n=1 Tax=uncultured Muribaculum sp. TaxID=1918613 RepID=UPI0026E58010
LSETCRLQLPALSEERKAEGLLRELIRIRRLLFCDCQFSRFCHQDDASEVLFVFSILLTSNPGDSSARLASKRRVMGIIAALLSFVVMGFALCRHEFWTALSRPFTTDLTMQEIGQVLLGTEKWQYLLPFEAVSVLLLACIIGGVVVARKR